MSSSFAWSDTDGCDEIAEMSDKRLLLVSNRLPITIKKDAESNEYTYSKSSGGLVTGLSGLAKKKKFMWYGWPGFEIPEDRVEEVRATLLEKYDAKPVLLDDTLADKHYNGFSNEILWAVLHYHATDITFDESNWTAYKDANRKFAKQIAQDVQDNDLIWVHDYHLMLLPQMLREEIAAQNRSINNVKIGFFLHTPFPSSEVYRVLPVRNDILEGLLHCDLIGFHTPDYRRHFINSCVKILDKNGNKAVGSGTTVEYKGRVVQTASCAIGIDPEIFEHTLEKESVKQRIASLRKKYEGVKIIIGVDRLDYIKGVPQKLHAFQIFLEKHPEWVGKAILFQIAVPSREKVEEYQDLKRSVNELVGKINGQFGDIEFCPVHLKHCSVSQEELTALYALSDACLVTSIRDGQNLVCYEYVACQQENQGVLLLSEFCGAQYVLGKGCITFMPWDSQQVANAIFEGLTMEEQERKEKYARLSNYVTKYTSAWWGQTFVAQLDKESEVDDDAASGLTKVSSKSSQSTSPRLNGKDKRKDSTLTNGHAGSIRWENSNPFDNLKGMLNALSTETSTTSTDASANASDSEASGPTYRKLSRSVTTH